MLYRSLPVAAVPIVSPDAIFLNHKSSHSQAWIIFKMRQNDQDDNKWLIFWRSTYFICKWFRHASFTKHVITAPFTQSLYHPIMSDIKSIVNFNVSVVTIMVTFYQCWFVDKLVNYCPLIFHCLFLSLFKVSSHHFFQSISELYWDPYLLRSFLWFDSTGVSYFTYQRLILVDFYQLIIVWSDFYQRRSISLSFPKYLK